MNDRQILEHIGELVDSEHALYVKAEHDAGLSSDDLERHEQLRATLDKCWELLERRRATRLAGGTASEAYPDDT